MGFQRVSFIYQICVQLSFRLTGASFAGLKNRFVMVHCLLLVHVFNDCLISRGDNVFSILFAAFLAERAQTPLKLSDRRY
ncbi:MAG: hypothetical protein ABW209_12620 [Pseudomonas caspiana]